MALGSLGLLTPVRKFAAEHHVSNADPLMVDFDLQSLEGRYTSVDDFYIRDHGPIPSLPGTNVLVIEGEVEKRRRILIDELRSLPTRESGAILECAGNPVGTLGKVSNGIWKVGR